MMPQFDTFSFFSQLFWVFAGFLSLYLAICFYLLPALGSILKVRKRMLAQVTTSSESVALVCNSSLLELTKQTFNSYSTKFSNLASSSSDSSSVTTSLTKNLGSITVKFAASRELNMAIFSQAHRTTLLYK
jgi:hypothetical protein